MRSRGKKTIAWEKTRAALKKLFERAGITNCELHYEGCWNSNGLSFCHSLKRNDITTQAQLEEVCLGCANCHPVIERKQKKEMYAIVRAVIASRSVTISPTQIKTKTKD